MLLKCHEENKFAKFFGACNDVKAEMDRCFRAEKEVKRKENLRKAREFDAKFEKYLEEKEKRGKEDGRL